MRQPVTLLIDADDTLWENIIVFNAVNQAYVDWLVPHRTLADMQPELDAHQVEMIATHGYGRDTFEKSLVSGVERFGGRAATAEDRQRIAELVAPLQWDTLDVRDGVAKTLEALAARHRLIMVTKGDFEEQSHKVERSGLSSFFNNIEILETKSVDEYEGLIEQYSLDPESTWMIGNSPRSDITPALACGLGAVFISHHETWSHEQADVPEHPRLVQLAHFSELLNYF